MDTTSLYIVVYELHVKGTVFYPKEIVEASSVKEALETRPRQQTDQWVLRPKGVIDIIPKSIWRILSKNNATLSSLFEIQGYIDISTVEVQKVDYNRINRHVMGPKYDE